MSNIIFKTQFFTFLLVTICGFGLPKIILAQSPVFEATVTNEINFQDMPSASGIVNFQDSYFVVGDDSPYLFQLDATFEIKKKIQLFSPKHMVDGRIPKKYKPDFECITVVPWGNDEDLLVFGSGSKDKREVLIRIDIDEGKESIESYSLKKFYKLLAKKTNGDAPINIEGAGYWKNHLILLNRGDNTLFKIDLDDFKAFVKGKTKDTPKIEAITFQLPSKNGVQARFSGISLLPDEDIIVFTASVENNPNWLVKDDIVCSYIGIIDLHQLENNTPVCELIKKNNIPIQEKVESIYTVSKSDSSIHMVSVIDNDNGSSKLIEIEFTKHID